MTDVLGIIAGLVDFNWAYAQMIGGNPGPFLVWTVAVFIMGLVVGTFVRRLLMNRNVSREFRDVPGFERVNTVDKLIEKAHEYSDRPERGEYELMKKNASGYLAQRGETEGDVRFRQEIVDTVDKLGNPGKAQEYLLEKMRGSIADNEFYGRALLDLKRYGCLDGYEIAEFSGRGRMSIAFGGGGVTVKRRDYPSARERDLEDIRELVDEQIEKALEKRDARNRRLERMNVRK